MCANLAYLFLDQVDDGVLLIAANTTDNEQLQPFIDYFVR